MKKLLLCSLLAIGLAYANEQHTWKMAQEFNNSVLKDIKYGYTGGCYIFGVYDGMFSVSCDPDHLIYELPYTWRSWKIIRTAPGFVIYSNEY